MKRMELRERDDDDQGAGDLEGPGARESYTRMVPSEEWSSGTYARVERAFPDAGGLAPVAQGPCRSFEEVYQRYKRFVWSRIQRPWIEESEANDLFQKVFLIMHQRTLREGVPADVAPVLLAIIGNQICNCLRERERRARRFDGEVDADTMPSSKPDPEQLCDRGDAKRKVATILARMPEDARLVFRLIEIDGLSLDEVAEMLDRPVGTLRVQLHRARARFCDLAKRLYKLDPGVSR